MTYRPNNAHELGLVNDPTGDAALDAAIAFGGRSPPMGAAVWPQRIITTGGA